MLVTDLLGAEVHDAGGRVGFVSDARFVVDETTTDQAMPIARLYGLIVSPHARSSSLGFERTGVSSPGPVAALVRRRHRGSFLVQWSDVLRIDDRQIRLRDDYSRRSSALSRSAAVPPELDNEPEG